LKNIKHIFKQVYFAGRVVAVVFLLSTLAAVIIYALSGADISRQVCFAFLLDFVF
jgi:hypothetical protein